eukprot:TRINITY_DN29855_c0_g1_i2.p1 TRINITY_DN29855_c0_g1~~TRINITY_DN29855_c0_g1_i2.p1  ORF type:complete len:630 (-),score=101.30 TRINITY_DN29855_c0_g1_i2:127-2016(-)
MESHPNGLALAAPEGVAIHKFEGRLHGAPVDKQEESAECVLTTADSSQAEFSPAIAVVATHKFLEEPLEEEEKTPLPMPVKAYAAYPVLQGAEDLHFQPLESCFGEASCSSNEFLKSGVPGVSDNKDASSPTASSPRRQSSMFLDEEDFGDESRSPVNKFISKHVMTPRKKKLRDSLQLTPDAEVAPYLSRVAWLLHRLEYVWEFWHSLDEPPRTSRIAQFISGNLFEGSCLAVVVVNSLWIWYTTDIAAATLPETQSGLESSVEAAFLTLYVIEFIFKFYVHRLYFFINQSAIWNMFDLFLIMSSLAEQLLLTQVDGVDVKFLRGIRMLRLTKVLRMLKVMRFVSRLRLVMVCLVGCAPSLVWAVTLIILILTVFAMFLVQGVTLYVIEMGDSIDEEILSQIEAWYGSVMVAMVTLFQCVSGGENWSGPYNMIRQTGQLNASVFLFFIFFFLVAVWNIVTSLFIERTMECAKPDLEDLMLQKRRKDQDDAKKLVALCDMIDDDGSRSISRQELEAFMDNEEFRQCFEVRGIDIKDATLFFHTLQAAAGLTEDSAVDIETFIGGCLRLKGLASSIDVQTLAFEAKVMHSLQKKFFAFVEARFLSVEERLDGLCPPEEERTSKDMKIAVL